MKISSTPFFAIGDVQGCSASLDELLALLPDNAQLLFLGDLINRGPDNLGVLRRIQSLGDRARFLLGNHDLHLLAVAAGHGKLHKKDTIGDILSAPDAQSWIDFLRRGRLALMHEGVLFVHAGLHPAWLADEALARAAEIEQQLAGDDWRDVFIDMYGPQAWSPELTGAPRRQAILNALTRMRFVDRRDGQLDFETKEGLASAPAHLVPWFEYAGRRDSSTPICFGHWSTLGLINRSDLMAVDTGCLWGGRLTAVSIPQREIVSVACPLWADPAAFQKQKAARS